MLFTDIIGQEAIAERLIQGVQEGRIPHAMLFAGPSGTGKLPMAVAYAQYLVCSGKSGGLFDEGIAGEACGTCPACVKMNKLVHPDVHFIYPTYKRDSSRGDKDTYPVSDEYISEWRETFLQNPYLELGEWLKTIGAEKQKGEIYVAQANEIIRKLSLRSSEGGYRVVILWLPEKMNDTCANKLLKLIEEPPSETVFLLVSDDVENVLPTIRSRAQLVVFHPIQEEAIRQALQQRFGIDEQQAAQVAHTSEGNWRKAVANVNQNDDTQPLLDAFIQLMRLAYGRRLKELKEWSDDVASWGRTPQRQFLLYCQRMIRESFICNFRSPELNYMNTAESAFTQRFAPFVNERNVEGLDAVLEEAGRDIEGNVNAKMVFFDLCLKMIMLLKQN
ncbi:MAG: DNA polymerase III subunit delta' [Bacteroidaceae bacterium]|nr:DNA polymerase III subunit delta' [Bacteroidaceae bacterium]